MVLEGHVLIVLNPLYEKWKVSEKAVAGKHKGFWECQNHTVQTQCKNVFLLLRWNLSQCNCTLPFVFSMWFPVKRESPSFKYWNNVVRLPQVFCAPGWHDLIPSVFPCTAGSPALYHKLKKKKITQRCPLAFTMKCW